MPDAQWTSFPNRSFALIQGASRGLGLAMTRALLATSRFTRIFACSRSATTASGLAELREQHPGRLICIDLDVTREHTIAAAAREIGTQTDRLHLVCNVAGLLHDASHHITPEKRLSDLDPDAFNELMHVNALGPALVVKHLIPLLRHTERTIIANLSARVGSIGDNNLGGWYSYRASKAAQNMLTRTMAIELGQHRRMGELICVALHPGTVATDLSKPYRAHVPDSKLFSTERAATQLLEIIDGLRPEDSGSFFAWDGSAIPW
ncbi:SDR family oxidoreductase [Lujinxingia sediminis]|uniref:SDR family oxidoreductase n=1 Tax=Lujinxingia sediminis TaxID=2480984 RepID=A0ABY0CQX7_9DELT|nr:SDR family oxidoreductase [Lujinxingia sediminis]RVU42874.1 SDR family oxidoreductase [Lujinxingia sediminis]